MSDCNIVGPFEINDINCEGEPFTSYIWLSKDAVEQGLEMVDLGRHKIVKEGDNWVVVEEDKKDE